MSSFNEIPAEILQQIFKYVQTSAKYEKSWMVQYQLVCKGWNQVAKAWLYSSIDFYHDTAMERFLQCMQNSSAGHLTRTMYLSTRYRKYEAAELYIDELAEACPNVECVKGAIRNYDFWRTLITAASKHWSCIKGLANPFVFIKHRNHLDCYNTLISFFRHSLSHIYLPLEHPSITTTKELYQRLPEFSSLTYLTVDYTVHPWSLVDYDEIVQPCPSLTSLSVNSKTYSLYVGSILPAPLDILSILSHNNIMVLHLCWPPYIGTVEYIMHKFPNLQNLLSRFGYVSFILENQLEDYFANVNDRLMEYISSMQTYEISEMASFSLFEAYLKHTANVHICFESVRDMPPMFSLQQTRMARIQFKNIPENKEMLLQMLKRHQHNITSFSLNLGIYDRDSTAWIEDIFITCTQMKAFHYLAKTDFEPPSQAAIDLNVPLNSTVNNLTLKVHAIEGRSFVGYLRLLPSVRSVKINNTYYSKYEDEDEYAIGFL